MSETPMVGLLAEALPVDGPHTAETVRAATYVLGELARYLVHATSSPAVATGPVMADTLRGLADATHTLDQVVHQLARTARTTCAYDPTVDDDRGQDPAEVGDRIADAADTARENLVDAVDALRAAASEAGHLVHRLT